jgi:hypothetical protein
MLAPRGRARADTRAMKRSNAPNLQRIAYHEGQLLSARDLGDDAAYESRLRGLHVRLLAYPNSRGGLGASSP